MAEPREDELLALIRRGYELWNQGDVNAVSRMWSDDFEWHNDPSWPGQRVYYGRETVVRFLDVGGSTLTADNVGYAIPAVYGSSGDDLYTVDDMSDVIVELAGEGIDEVRTSLGSKTPPAYAV